MRHILCQQVFFHRARWLPVFFLPGPVGYLSPVALISSRAVLDHPRRHLLLAALAPPRRPLLLAAIALPRSPFPPPLAGSSNRPFSLTPPCALVVSQIGGGSSLGVVEILFVVEIVPMDLFVVTYVSFFSISFLDSRYYHGVLTLTSMYLVFCFHSSSLSTPLSPLFGCVS